MKNPKALAFRILVCIFFASLTLYALTHKQNALTELRLTIPILTKEVRRIKEENIRLQYEIDRFESPIHLMELARKPEYGHLHYPLVRDVILIPEGEVPPWMD